MTVVRRVSMMVVLAALVLVACDDGPSDTAIEAAVQQVGAAPVPAGAVDTDSPPQGLAVAGRVGDATVYQQSLCSDESCPLLVRWFNTNAYSVLDDACAALTEYVTAVGGAGPAACPGPSAHGTEVSGDQAAVVVSDSVVVPNGRYGNTVLYEIQFQRAADGTPDGGAPATLTLGIGQQFCSSLAVAAACVNGA